MEVRTFTIGSLCTNCYLVWGENTDQCILIDPGYEPEYLLEQVRLCRKTLEAILLTHGHFDHVGGVKQIAEETGCKVYICPEELLVPPRFTAGEHYYTHTYRDGDTLQLAGLSLQVLHTPGHTLGSVCLLCENTLFSGDTLFAGTCGRTDLPGGNYQTMLSSLRRLYRLEGDYKVLPGHGNSSTLAQERIENPCLQLC